MAITLPAGKLSGSMCVGQVGPVARRRDLTSDGIQAGQLKRTFMFGPYPAYTLTRIRPPSGIERRKRTTSPGKARLLPVSATRQLCSTDGSSLIRYTTFTSPSETCFQDPVVEMISSVRWARQWMASEEGASCDVA